MPLMNGPQPQRPRPTGAGISLPSSQNPQPYSYSGPTMTMLTDPQVSAMQNPQPQTSFMGNMFGRGGGGPMSPWRRPLAMGGGNPTVF